MKKPNIDECWLEISIAVSGILLLLISILADTIGLGHHLGFGRMQTILAALGGCMVLAAGLILVGRCYGWRKLNIPFPSTIKVQFLRYWRDIVFIVVLASISGFIAYLAERLIPPAVFSCNFEATWFHGDLTAMFWIMTHGRWPYPPSESTHILFPLVTYPPVHLLIGMGINSITAVRIVVALFAAAWVSMLFAVLRTIGCRRFDATLFTILGTISASAMFWLVVPETFLLGSLSILLMLLLVALSERRYLSSLWYTLASALTLGITVTNWMVGIIATIVNFPWKRSLQITINALSLVLVYWELRPYILSVPQGQSFFSFVFRTDETVAQGKNLMLQQPGGPVRIFTSFIFHTIVMPAFKIADKSTRWDPPLMFTQYSLPGSASLWGAAAVVLWGALLLIGVWAMFTNKGHYSMRIVIGLSILGQLALHMVFGDETFLYSLHFVPLLIMLVAMSSQTRLRTIVLVLAGALVLCAGVNNGLQFISAVKLVQCIHWMGY